MNPLSWFVTLREKLMAIVALFLMGLVVGWHLHSVVDTYFDNLDKSAQLYKAKEAPAKIIDFNQKMRAAHAEKDACANQSIPPAVLDLLRQ